MPPFTTAWMSAHHAAAAPVALYGITVFLCGVAYTLLVRSVLRVNPPETGLREATGKEWKGWVSLGAYAAAISLAFLNRWISVALYVCVALLWFLPDSRMERVLLNAPGERGRTSAD